MNAYLASLGPELANHLWQTTAFGLLAWLLTLALRRNRARVRYAIWMAASIKFLIPFSLLIAAGNLLPHSKQPVAAVVYSAVYTVEEPFAADASQVFATPVYVPTVRDRAKAALPICVGIVWLLGVGLVLFGWCNRWRVVSRIVRHASVAKQGREFEILRRLEGGGVGRLPLLMSAERMEPGIFGVFRPALVWPAQLSESLDDQHIEAIMAHELTHVRRRDNLTALVHMIVEAVFWFHPLVWWMERQMVKEREQACDEAVVEMGGSAETYAESLLKTCWFCIESPLACVAGVTGADLKRRVADIMTGRALMRMTWPKKLLVVAVAVGALLAPVLLGQAKAAQHFMQSAIKMAPKPDRQVTASASAAQEAAANDSDSGAAFDVATIRPMNDKDRHWFGFRLAPSGRLTVSAVPLTGLVGFSSIVSGEVSGGPAWADSQKWDITAEADTSKIPDWNQLSDEERMNRIKPMLRKLVVERFHLKGHAETRLENVYAMVPAKHGVKLGGALKRASPPPAHTDPDELDAKLRGKKPIAGPPAQGFRFDPNGTWWFRSVRPNFLALQLAALCRIDGRAVDQSGLEGYYDLTFKPDSDPDAPSLESQVEVQLGLRFEAKKVPMPTYVIDSAEKPSVDGAEVQPQMDSPSASAAAPSTVPVSVVSNVKPPAFDVASIHLHKPLPHERNHLWSSPSDGNFRTLNVTLNAVIQFAFDMPESRIVGAPAWASSQYFDIEAKSDDAVNQRLHDLPPDQAKAVKLAMIQTLLADRFGLKTHREQRVLPTYNLVLAKSGSKLVPSQEDGLRTNNWNNGFSAQGISMPMLAQYLTRYAGRIIIDNTNLPGRFDVDLHWHPDDAPTDTNDAVYPPFFTAVQEQLGLRLEPAKGPVDVLVIDNVQMPTGN